MELRAQQRQEEQEVVRWEEDMRAMIAADEERDLQARREREFRRNAAAKPDGSLDRKHGSSEARRH